MIRFNKMSCSHNGISFETLHWKRFVHCEICGNWRLRHKKEVFWTGTLDSNAKIIYSRKRFKDKMINIIS